MHRFFVPPEWLEGDRAVISGSLVHQLSHVLRLRPTDHILILDNSGWEYEIELDSFTRSQVSGKVVRRSRVSGEPRTKITLYQALLKGRNFEYVLQKGTELGIATFVPLVSDRCVIGSLQQVTKRKQGRWQRIILEAAEQSHRGKLPDLQDPTLFLQACQRASKEGLSLIPWEEEEETNIRVALEDCAHDSHPLSINLLIGPEGGFTASEIELACNYGIVPVTLGPRTFRAETAGLVAATAVLFWLHELE